MPKSVLKSIYYSIFNSHLIYGSQIWGQGLSESNKINKLQKKAIKIFSSTSNDNYENTLQELKILKFTDYIKLQNCLFVNSFIHKTLPPNFNNYFSEEIILHKHNTCYSQIKRFKQMTVNSKKYGELSIKFQCIKDWNNLKNKYHRELDSLKSSNSNKVIKNFIKNKLLSNY